MTEETTNHIITSEQIEEIYTYLEDETNDPLRFKVFDTLKLVSSTPYDPDAVRKDEKIKFVKYLEERLQYFRNLQYTDAYPVNMVFMDMIGSLRKELSCDSQDGG